MVPFELLNSCHLKRPLHSRNPSFLLYKCMASVFDPEFVIFSDLERASFSRDFFDQVEPLLLNDNQHLDVEHNEANVLHYSIDNTITKLNNEFTNFDLPQVNREEEQIKDVFLSSFVLYSYLLQNNCIAHFYGNLTQYVTNFVSDQFTDFVLN